MRTPGHARMRRGRAEPASYEPARSLRKASLHGLLACALIASLAACGGSDGSANSGAADSNTTGTQTPPTVSISAPSAGTPPAAAAVGYQTQTFGPAVTLGANWFNMNFFRPPTNAAQNGDGTVSISNDQSIASATRDTSMPQQWRGMAFGGGAYFEAVLHFSNADDSTLTSWPAFWGSDIENVSQNAVTELTQWSGQPEGFGNWIETDFFEFDRHSVSEYGIQIHNWYGYHGQPKDVLAYGQPVRVAAGFKWSDSHKYGYLWVPATATTRGYAMAFMDDVQMGATIYWDQYDPEAPPPPQPGTTAFSVVDRRHLILIIQTDPHNPMTIETVTVWQASDRDNITQ